MRLRTVGELRRFLESSAYSDDMLLGSETPGIHDEGVPVMGLEVKVRSQRNYIVTPRRSGSTGFSSFFCEGLADPVPDRGDPCAKWDGPAYEVLAFTEPEG